MLWTLVPVLNTCVIAAVNSHSLTSLSLMLIKKKKAVCHVTRKLDSTKSFGLKTFLLLTVTKHWQWRLLP